MKIDRVRKRLERLRQAHNNSGRVYFFDKVPEGWEVRHPMTGKSKIMTETEYQVFLDTRDRTDTVFFFERDIM